MGPGTAGCTVCCVVVVVVPEGAELQADRSAMVAASRLGTTIFFLVMWVVVLVFWLSPHRQGKGQRGSKRSMGCCPRPLSAQSAVGRQGKSPAGFLLTHIDISGRRRGGARSLRRPGTIGAFTSSLAVARAAPDGGA